MSYWFLNGAKHSNIIVQSETIGNSRVVWKNFYLPQQNYKRKNNMNLILVAIKDELSEKDLPGFQIHYSGVGKINAAIKTLKIIKDYSPSLIVNYGTAGSLNKELRGLVEVTRFFQRDMDATPLGFKVGQTPFDDIGEINFGSGGYSCGTGDSFVTKTPKLKTDLVDMEAYAIAKICFIEDIKFKCFKYISDNADTGANEDWIENVSLGKKLFVKKMRNLMPN